MVLVVIPTKLTNYCWIPHQMCEQTRGPPVLSSPSTADTLGKLPSSQLAASFLQPYMTIDGSQVTNFLFTDYTWGTCAISCRIKPQRDPCIR